MSSHANLLSTTQVILIAQLCIQAFILVTLISIVYLVYHTRVGASPGKDQRENASMTSGPDLQDVAQLDEAILRTKNHLDESTVQHATAFEQLHQVVEFLSTTDTRKIETTNPEDTDLDTGTNMANIDFLSSRKRSVSAPSESALSATTAVHEATRTTAQSTPSATDKKTPYTAIKLTDPSSSVPKPSYSMALANAKATLEEATSILLTDTVKTTTLLQSHLSTLANAHTHISTQTTRLKSLHTALLTKDKALTSTTTENITKNAELQTLRTELNDLKHDHQTTLTTTTKARVSFEKQFSAAQQDTSMLKNTLAAEQAKVARLKTILDIKNAAIERLEKRILLFEARAVLSRKPSFSTDGAVTKKGGEWGREQHDEVKETGDREPNETAAIRKILRPTLAESLATPAEVEKEKSEIAEQRAQVSEIEHAQRSMDEELADILRDQGGVARAWGAGSDGSGSSDDEGD